jgi:caa(3)-type oxidase subunit IV
MGATVGVSYVHLGTVVNNVVAMAIAVLKASLVVAIFMGVAHGTKLIKFWAISGLSAITLFAWVFIDYASRTPEVVPGFYHDEGSAMHSGNLPNDPSTMQPTPKTEGEKGE